MGFVNRVSKQLFTSAFYCLLFCYFLYVIITLGVHTAQFMCMKTPSAQAFLREITCTDGNTFAIEEITLSIKLSYRDNRIRYIPKVVLIDTRYCPEKGAPGNATVGAKGNETKQKLITIGCQQ